MAQHAVDVSKLITAETIKIFIDKIIDSNRIYLVGVGKSGLISKAFTMSLLSLDKDAYIVGESLMPTPEKEDLIIAVSGTGESDYTIKTATLGKRLGANLVVITSQLDSTLGRLGGNNILIPGRRKGIKEKQTSKRLILGEHGGTAGALFEIGCFLFLNTVSSLLEEENYLGKKK